MIRIYTSTAQGQQWLDRYRAKRPHFACILGFTDTGLIPGISAAGATPEDRRYTAIADAEFLYNGPRHQPKYPLPPLHAGASPVLISRAVLAAQAIPLSIFNAGLPQPPSIPAIDLGGTPASCLSTGNALDLAMVKHLFDRGLEWGDKLAFQNQDGYLIVSECVVGGTTTALAILTALGIPAAGKVNSSHPHCNHSQKLSVVRAGLERAGLGKSEWANESARDSCRDAIDRVWSVGELESWRAEKTISSPLTESGLGNQAPTDPFTPNSPLTESGLGNQAPTDPFTPHSSPLTPHPFDTPLQAIAAVGDPMQAVAAGMAIAASRRGGVLLAGGTQMLAVYALSAAIADFYSLSWCPDRIVVGTTRWVAEDPTGDTVGLAKAISTVPLLGTQLSFAASRYPHLRAYERGFVKEGVGAGGCAIAAHLYQNWSQSELLHAIEAIAMQYEQLCD